MFYCIAIGPLPKMVQVCFQYEQVTLGGTVQPEEECPPGPVQSTIRLIDQWVLCHFCWYNLLPGLYRPFRLWTCFPCVRRTRPGRGRLTNTTSTLNHLSSVIPPDKKIESKM